MSSESPSRGRTCAVCGAPSRANCGACHQVWYCGPEHQREHWRAGGHKEVCGQATPKGFAGASTASADSAKSLADPAVEESKEVSSAGSADPHNGGAIPLYEAGPRNKVLVVGAAGVGKTRVIQDLLRSTPGPESDGEASRDACPRQGNPVTQVCPRAASNPALAGVRWWPYPVATKYYSAVLDLWEVPTESCELPQEGGLSSPSSPDAQSSPAVTAAVREVLRDAQALVLVFDAGRPETFRALRPWGEALLQLQEAASNGSPSSGSSRFGPGKGGSDDEEALPPPPEVCVCVGNSVAAQGAGGRLWQQAVAEANEWCIDHGLELVSLAHGAVGAEHPIECRSLLHDLHTSLQGTGRLAEALQCNMWRALTLTSSMGGGSGSGGAGKRSGGLLAGFLGGSSDYGGDSEDEANQGAGGRSSGGGGFGSFGRLLAGGAGDGDDDDWVVDDRDFSQPPASQRQPQGEAKPAQPGDIRISVMSEAEERVSGASRSGSSGVQGVDSEDDEDDEDEDQEIENFFRARAAEAERWFDDDDVGGGSGAAGDDRWEDAVVVNRGGSGHPEIRTDRLGAFDPANYQELPSGDEDEDHTPSDPDHGVGGDVDGFGDGFQPFVDSEDELPAAARADAEEAKEPSEQVSASGEAGSNSVGQEPSTSPQEPVPSDSSSPTPSDGVQAAAIATGGKKKNKKKKNKAKSRAQSSTQQQQMSLSDAGLEAEMAADEQQDLEWEQLINQLQRVRANAQRMPDELRRKNAEEGLMALLKFWDKQDLDKDEDEEDEETDAPPSS